MGARIEIPLIMASPPGSLVAPLVGARIEISEQDCHCQSGQSLPSWERGLKFRVVSPCPTRNPVAPLVGARIEIEDEKVEYLNGLKSLPSWERGLKYLGKSAHFGGVIVAPLVGARIEIAHLSACRAEASRRSPRGSAD